MLEQNDANGLFNTIKEKSYFKWSTSRSMSGFSDFPMDKKLPDWFTIQNYVDYLDSYKKHFNLEQYIQYNSCVKNCKQNENEEWIVSYTISGSQTQLICKKLIICAGLNQTPKFPDIVKNYTGEIIHTETVYRNMSKQDWINKFSNKRVLLLGGAESAFDIGHIIVQNTNDLYFASKDYIEWFPQGNEQKNNVDRAKKLNSDCLNNSVFQSKGEGTSTPTDTKLFYAEYSLPEPMSEYWHIYGRWIFHTFLNVKCGKCMHQHKELCDKTDTPDDLFKKYVVKRTEFMIDIYDNKVNILYYPDKIENKTVITRDKTIENVDIIVCATGYKKQFPFLDDKIINDEFIKKMVPKNTSNIAFIGYARPTMGSIASIAEMQSWWVESYFANTLTYRERTPILRFKDPLNLQNEHINTIIIGCFYLKDLARDMRIEPNMLYLLFTDFQLFNKIYTGSCHPMIYRIHGDKYYPGSREVLMSTLYGVDTESQYYAKLYLSMFVLFHIIFLILLCIVSYILFGIFKFFDRKQKYNKYGFYLILLSFILWIYFIPFYI